MWHLSISILPTSLRIIHPRHIHVVANGNLSMLWLGYSSYCMNIYKTSSLPISGLFRLLPNPGYFM